MLHTKEYYIYAAIDGRIVLLDFMREIDIEAAIMLAIQEFPSIPHRNIFALPYHNEEAA